MPNKVIETYEGNVDDKILNDLHSAVEPVTTAVESSENHAILTLGVKYLEGADGNEESVQTYINAAGYFGILAEGLFAEILDQINNGHWGLFTILREVVRDIEEEFDITPDQELEVPGESTTLH